MYFQQHAFLYLQHVRIFLGSKIAGILYTTLPSPLQKSLFEAYKKNGLLRSLPISL